MYDFSGKESAFIVILECGYLSDMPECGCVWTALVSDNRRLGLRQGHK